MRHPHLEVIRAGMRTDEAKACIAIADEVYNATDPLMVNAARGWITTAAAIDKAAEDRLNDADRAKLEAKFEARAAGDELREIQAGNVRNIRGGR